MYAYLGLHEYITIKSSVQKIKVDKFLVHPDYDPFSDTVSNDIALAKLSIPATFTKAASPICLPTGKQVKVGDKLIITGWVSAT